MIAGILVLLLTAEADVAIDVVHLLSSGGCGSGIQWVIFLPHSGPQHSCHLSTVFPRTTERRKNRGFTAHFSVHPITTTDFQLPFGNLGNLSSTLIHLLIIQSSLIRLRHRCPCDNFPVTVPLNIPPSVNRAGDSNIP